MVESAEKQNEDENTAVQPTSIRRVERTQCIDRKHLSPEETKQLLTTRKASSAKAAWWPKLRIETVLCKEVVNGETVVFERVVVTCIECNKSHGGASLNPGNFAQSHFHNAKTKPECKSAAQTSALSSWQVALKNACIDRVEYCRV